LKKQKQGIKGDTDSGRVDNNQQTSKKKDSSIEDKEKVLFIYFVCSINF